jgi:hypothetical protein
MLEEKPAAPMLEDKSGKPDAPRDRSEEFRGEIVKLFADRPELSNYEFKPVIVRNGQVEEHDYIVRHTDGNIINQRSNRIKSK